MEPQAEAILQMSETLESAGFTRNQSNAVIQSVARSMKTFSVTPEILEAHFSKHRSEVLGLLDEQKQDTNSRFDEIKNDVRDLQRTVTRFFWTFTVVVLGAILATLGTLLTP